MNKPYTDYKTDEVKETGGARIGITNATWPFAKLRVNRNELNLNASIIGNLSFTPADVISIVPASETFGGSGIKINHSVKNYNEKVIFLTSGNPVDLIRRIKQTGFLDNTDIIPDYIKSEIISRQSKGGYPLKISATIAIIVVWNLLFLHDFYFFFTGNGKGKASPLGIGAQLAFGFVFLTCLSLLVSEPSRKLILKEGRSINDIKVFLYFIMLIMGVSLLMSLLLSRI